MRTVELAIIVLVLASSRTATAQVEEQKLASGKSYLSFKPAEVAPKPLLVVDLHHGQSTSGAKGAKVGIEYWKKLASLKHIVIAPDYEGDDWKVYEDMSGGAAPGKKAEIQYILDCVDDAQKKFKIEKGRILITGTSSGGDYAFEIALGHPDKFAGAIPVTPGWCGKPSSFDESAKKVRVYFIVGGTDPRRKQTIEAYERLRKVTGDVVWRMPPTLGHERPAAEEIERALRWEEEMLASEPGDATLKWASEQATGDVPQAGIHLLKRIAAESKKKTFAKEAQKLLAKIEKQAQSELADAKKLCDKKDEKAGESLWRLYDRYGALSLWDDVAALIQKSGAQAK